MTESPENNSEIKLPGYQLEKRIGSGGYGEVWLAHAPGGLTKAVKFIFGYHNEKRASSELRSLEKIKAVRHPFLLSLERIEVLEGKLVIVTELADGSLKDRFDHFVQEGLPGIPREELLGYMRDSADALDYLSDHHSLQHLDVKPENFLLLAGHVKVADFGLVKEIQDTQVSLVGGMTPLYSAPEVFQGKPTRHSDQYSLAVLYQEMLTGKLPFSGTTSAELTLQHMHDDPDLDPLPISDRYVLARALAKDPQQRYVSCRELVQALFNTNQEQVPCRSDWNVRSPITQTPTSTPTAADRKSRPGTMTQVFEVDLINDSTQLSKSMIIDIPEAFEQVADPLSPMDLEPKEFQPTPTLVIGIGGTGGMVLGQFRKLLNRRFGTSCEIPAVKLLQLDTDKKSLLEMTHSGDGASLSSEETMALQLRRPQEYRDSSKRLLKWLSRRWLYNIPKSLRTEGLRPLGRLAFADHARRTMQRIRLALTDALEEHSREQSSEETGMEFRDQGVRVYVVASVSGGTGSGMSIDVGYAIQGLLEKLGIENATTTGVFLHSTGRDSRYCDLAKVNAFSWLKEYHHFSRAEGFYPGDEASGLPSMPVGTPAFDITYFLNLGDGLTPEQLKQNTESVAQYLLQDSLSPAQMFFEASRESLPANVAGHPTLRTFGLREESAISDQALLAIAQQVCQRVVLKWSGSENDDTRCFDTQVHPANHDQETTSLSDTNQIVSGAPQAVAQLQLSLEGISANARSILEGQFGNNVEMLLSKLLAESREQGETLDSAGVMRLVDNLFAAVPGTESSSRDYVLGRRLESILSPLGMKLAADLQKWLMLRLDQGQQRLSGTRQAAEWFASHFKRVEADAQRLAQGIGQKLTAMQQHRGASEAANRVPASMDSTISGLELAIKYFRLRLDLRALQGTSHLVRTLQSELINTREAIVEFGRCLRHLAAKLSLEDDSDAAHQHTLATQDPVGRLLLTDLAGLVTSVDQQIQQQFIVQQGGLFQTVMGNRKILSELLESLLRIAKQQIEISVREMTLRGNRALGTESIQKHSESANSSLSNLGGTTNCLVILPQSENCEQLASTIRSTLGSNTSLLMGMEGNIIVCKDTGQLSMARVAVDLIDCRRDYAELADRVHTRNDIPWYPLIDPQQIVNSITPEYATQIL